MDTVLLIISGVMALGGLWLIVDFLLWEYNGRKAVARIEGFQSKKSGWLRLPLVAFEDEKNATIQAPVQRIDQMIYYVVNPGIGDITTIIYRVLPPTHQAAHQTGRQPDSQPGNHALVRVYGFLRLIAGALLCVPLLLTLAMMAQNALVFAQVLYVVCFIAMFAGGLAFLKFIQKT